MKRKIFILGLGVFTAFLFSGCQGGNMDANTDSAGDSGSAVEQEEIERTGQANVVDDVSANNVVDVAVGSPDHTTLVAAVQAGDLVQDLSNNGPFTVFAPTNAAFEALPEGTVENLLKPENIDALKNILKYHVAAPAYKLEYLSDGYEMTQAQMDKVTLNKKEDGSWTVNGANILATVEASNGIVYVIDAVLLPPEE